MRLQRAEKSFITPSEGNVERRVGRIEILTIERILGNYHTKLYGKFGFERHATTDLTNPFCSFSTNYFVVVRRDLKLANRFVESKRPMISGRYTGFSNRHSLKDSRKLTLFIVVAIDEDNQILPLAWAFVPIKSIDNWTFFLSYFRRIFPSVRMRMQKSLLLVIGARDQSLH